MISHTTKQFRLLLRELPIEVQRQARQTYRTWSRDPWHSSLHFKRIHHTDPVFSVRISLGWRAVGVRSGKKMIWYWIGSHGDYDKLLAKF